MLDSLINAYQSLAAVNPLSHIAGMTLSLPPAHVCVLVCVQVCHSWHELWLNMTHTTRRPMRSFGDNANDNAMPRLLLRPTAVKVAHICHIMHTHKHTHVRIVSCAHIYLCAFSYVLPHVLYRRIAWLRFLSRYGCDIQRLHHGFDFEMSHAKATLASLSPSLSL